MCILAEAMKKDIHPNNYRPVVFKDLNNSTTFLTRSTVASEETIKWEDGNDYPLVTVHISSASHPYFTGEEKVIDIEGRVDRFKAKAKAAKAAKESRTKAATKKVKRAEVKAEKAEAKKTVE